MAVVQLKLASSVAETPEGFVAFIHYDDGERSEDVFDLALWVLKNTIAATKPFETLNEAKNEGSKLLSHFMERIKASGNEASWLN